MERIWRKLDRSQMLLVDAHLLFLDAVLSFQNGAFMATAVMCRASAETALYLLMTRGQSDFQDTPAIVIDYSYVHDRFATLLKKARSRNLIGDMLQRVFTRLIEVGNLAAHLGSIADKIMEREDSLRWSVEEPDAKGALRDAVRILNALSPKFPKHDGFMKVTIEP